MAQIDSLFTYLVQQRGSDLHLSEGQPPKVRVHGSIVPIPDQPVLLGEVFRDLLAEICDPKAFAKYLESGDLDFAYAMDEQSRFRCNYLKQSNGLAAVFRLIPESRYTFAGSEQQDQKSQENCGGDQHLQQGESPRALDR